jgi:ribosomal protein S18 acetylase RimI-like enzyme
MTTHPTPDTYRFLDELAANAWPAQVQQGLESWRLRAAEGVTRRANSVLTAGPIPVYRDWLHHIEDFYERRGLPPRFQMSDGSPAELDPLLQSHGYEVEATTGVLVAEAQSVIANAGDRLRTPTSASASISEEWLNAFMAVEGFPESKKAAYRSIYSAIGPRSLYVRVTADLRTVGVGMAVTERGWSGLFGIATSPEYRGRGVATHILGTLAQWSVSSAAPNLYLQVMHNNNSALSLYTKLGFSHLYDYHYRTKV